MIVQPSKSKKPINDVPDIRIRGVVEMLGRPPEPPEAPRRPSNPGA